MKPAPFEMLQPTELEDALRLLAAHADAAKVIAGGQSLVPLMNLRMATPDILLDLNRVPSLAGVSRDGDVVRIGAMTRQMELLRTPVIASAVPLLAQAAAHIGHVQTRSRGTIGGSVAHADPSAEIPLVLAVLDAEIVVRSVRGVRTIRSRDFFVGLLTTDLAADEIVVEIRVPAAPAGTRASFREAARRHGDFAIAAAAVQYAPLPSAPSLRAGLGGVGPVPHVCDKLCAAFQRDPVHTNMSSLVRGEIEQLKPSSDLQASADFRRTLASVLLGDCLNDCLAEVPT